MERECSPALPRGEVAKLLDATQYAGTRLDHGAESPWNYRRSRFLRRRRLRRAGQRLELLRSRQTGLIGVDWTATVAYAVISTQSTDTITVHARKITALFPWRVTAVTSTRRSQ